MTNYKYGRPAGYFGTVSAMQTQEKKAPYSMSTLTRVHPPVTTLFPQNFLRNAQIATREVARAMSKTLCPRIATALVFRSRFVSRPASRLLQKSVQAGRRLAEQMFIVISHRSPVGQSPISCDPNRQPKNGKKPVQLKFLGNAPFLQRYCL